VSSQESLVRSALALPNRVARAGLAFWEHPAPRFAFAVVAAALAVAVARFIPAVLFGEPFLPAMAAVLVTGLLAGGAPAAVTLGLALVALAPFLPPGNGVGNATRLVIFAVVGGAVAGVATASRAILRREQRALGAERTARARLSALQGMTAALANCATAEEVAAVALDRGLAAVGSPLGVVAGVTADGSAVEVVASRGYDDAFVDHFRRLPLDAPYPSSAAVRHREAIFLESEEAVLRDWPAMSSLAVLPRREALVSLPLSTPRGTLGVLALAFLERRIFKDPERRFLLSMAAQCGQALERVRHAERERAAMERLQGRHAELLAERKRLAEVLAQAQAASRAKDEFLAMLSHELRNPLSPIVTALDMMAMGGTGPFAKERAVLERQVRHLRQLVDDLLDVARVSRGKIVLRRRVVPLAEVVERAVELSSPLFEEKGHALDVEVPADLRVDADERRLAQAVSNLLTNAAKYTEGRGHVLVRAARDGARVRLTVSDDGAGIPAELLPRIFDLFFQGSRQADRAPGGLGLGLAIVKSFVQLHGGEVRAESPGAGKGSTFTIELPAAEGDGAEPAPVRLEPRAAPARRVRVLVVDDNRDAAELAAEVLADLGEVRVAYDGPGALEILRSFVPDVALVDIGLPVMDGHELARRILERLPGTRLVAVTGYGQESDRLRSAEAGFAVHLVKPVDVDVLRAAVVGGIAEDEARERVG
jgi:signal transduction histidine kinase/ActR/RegA family two-component response regulator